MEDDSNLEVVNIEKVNISEDKDEGDDSKSSEDVWPNEEVKLETFDGAQETVDGAQETVDGAQVSKQSPDTKNEYHHVFEFRRSFLFLKSMPDEVLKMKNLKTLDLSNNNIVNIPDDIKNLSLLEKLDLSHNNLKSLPKNLNIPQLKYLNIGHNNFYEIPSALYDSLPCLRFLDISNNFIEYFPKPPFCSNYLEKLILSSNDFNLIPRWVFFLRLLNFIDLANNSLSNIHSNFLHEQVIVHLNNSIKFINMGNCQINNDRLNFVSCLLSLETLILSNTSDVDEDHKNCLPILSENIFSRARNLKHLLASNVELLFLHHNFDSMISLQYVDLSHNKLTWLPDSFSNVITLTECRLNSNGISFLPDEFGKLANLKRLYLSDNNLVELPKSFTLLLNLEYCDLYDNQLESIDTDIIKLKSLKGIDLEDNSLDINLLCKEEEDLLKFREIYNSLKESYRKELGEERVDLQNPEKVKSEKGKNRQYVIPDFISDYESSEVYSLRGETILANWDEYSHNYMFDDYNEGATSSEDSRPCFRRSSFARYIPQKKFPKKVVTDVVEGQFDSD